MQKTIITYGTFDLFHVGHVRLLKRIKDLGDRLIVGLSSDEFNLGKGKKSFYSYEERKEILLSCRYVDEVFKEDNWEQKRNDIIKYKADCLCMGDDWAGKFDDLGDVCEVIYLPRTSGVSTTEIKRSLSLITPEQCKEMQDSLTLTLDIVKMISLAMKDK